MTNKQREIEERVLKTARCIINRHCTIREAAKHVGSTKTTVHSDITMRLPELNLYLYAQVRSIIAENKRMRSHRAGQATARVYRQRREAQARLNRGSDNEK